MIEPKYNILNTLFADRVFRIPDYQRFYSWEKKQREDLFGDIQKLAAKREDAHFMATIVCHKTDEVKPVGTSEYRVYDIVDGQQRITTLIILLKEAQKALRDANEKRKIGEILVKSDGNLLLLQTNNPNQRLFNDYLRTGVLPDRSQIITQADKNLANAIRQCEQFVRENWKDKELDLLRILLNRLGFVVYDTENRSAVYTLFEVLNSRGLEVDWLDKCKTLLMGKVYDLASNAAVRDSKLSDINARWSAIYQRLATHAVPGHEVMRITVTLFVLNDVSKPVSAERAIKEIATFCKTAEDPITVTQWLYNIADKFVDLSKERYLDAVTDILHSRTLAVAIKLADFLNEKEREKALDQWERVSFRIFGLARKDSRQKVGEFIRLSRKILKRDMEDAITRYSDLMTELRELGSDFDGSTIVQDLYGTDFYNANPEDTRYMLWKYEEALAKNANGEVNKEIRAKIWEDREAAETIEHIFPQSPEEGGAWEGKLGSEKLEVLVHRIGNLILLPNKVNEQARRKSFGSKKEIHRSAEGLRMIQEILRLDDWTDQHIKERESQILEWAKSAWADLPD